MAHDLKSAAVLVQESRFRVMESVRTILSLRDSIESTEAVIEATELMIARTDRERLGIELTGGPSERAMVTMRECEAG